jgi:hypothetical protein
MNGNLNLRKAVHTMPAGIPKCGLAGRGESRASTGVALVVTLIMLSVVTFMAVTFLALSRRERASITGTQDQSTANLMADAAMARAQAEAVSRIMAHTNMGSYEFMVSTNYINPAGFIANNNFNPANVAFRESSGAPLTPDEMRTVLKNLLFDPRAPVFVTTQANARPDFRYYLDLNRNGTNEPNGLQPVYGNDGTYLGYSNVFVGDPEWIGVLEKPNLPHSASNRFVGRYAFMALPMGKSLDLNFMYNQVKMIRPQWDGYMRNQGVGSWELNLAAFLTDLNPNFNFWPSNGASAAYPYYSYNTNVGASSSGAAFSNALTILQYRYRTNYNNLSSISNLYGVPGANAVRTNQVDDYSDGPYMTSTLALTNEPNFLNQAGGPGRDNPTLPWPGSDTPQMFFDLQELFDGNKTSMDFTNRLLVGAMAGPGRSTFDHYTFYRMAAQLGVDSDPVPGKINLNYDNYDPRARTFGEATNFANWTGSNFFNLTAERMFRQKYSLFKNVPNSISNICVYPPADNQYTPAVHQLLQLAANIYCAVGTNEPTGAAYPQGLPSVFRPVFRVDNGRVFINGYIEDKGTNFVGNRWYDLNVPNPAPALALLSANPANANIYGVPVVIGVKKGYPNFNECTMRTVMEVTRKVDVSRPTTFADPNRTNVMFIMGVSNIFAIEAWNSYSKAYQRQVEIRVTNSVLMYLTNFAGWGYNHGPGFQPVLRTNFIKYSWPSNQFLVITNTSISNAIFLSNSIVNGTVLRPLNPAFFVPPAVLTNVVGSTNHIWLIATNRMQYVAIDRMARRVIDFVNLDNLAVQVDITGLLLGNANMQQTNDAITRLVWNAKDGLTNQIQISLGQLGGVGEADWKSASKNALTGSDREKSIDRFRAFVKLTPLKYSPADVQQEINKTLVMQAPFTPTRRVAYTVSLQANDPLVHYTVGDLYDQMITNQFDSIKPADGPLPANNIGFLNRRYQPWSGNPDVSGDTNKFNLALKDPMVKSSDDWDFPTNKFPSIGWLGRVHRGTPWQTMYLKSEVAETNAWRLWSGNYFTHPTNDWSLLELFTTAVSANATRGLLSVNQTNQAAWSAVLSGVMVMSNTSPNANPPTNVSVAIIQPNSRELRTIVDGINQTRSTMSNGVFNHLGEFLATPELSFNSRSGRISPYLTNILSLYYRQPESVKVSDQVFERIPEMILGLVREDHPGYVVYTYGQALAPAPNSLVLAGSDRGLCTNYVVVSESASKHVLRISGTATNPVIVPERFQYIPND